MARILSSILLSMALLLHQAFAADVCHLPSFAGMEKNKARALSILSKETTGDMSKAQVYVEFDDGVLYYHSNFIAKDEDGRPYMYPTKVMGSPSKDEVFSDARVMFMNIVFSSPPNAGQAAAMDKALQESVQFHVDVSVFDENGRPRVDLSDISKLHIVDGKRGQSIGGQPELLTTAKPPPSLIARLKGCCLYGRPPHAASGLLDALDRMPFKASDVKFASLFVDSATEVAVKNNPLVRTARLPGDGKKLAGKEDFAKLVAQSKGSTLVLVGHVEGKDFVTRDSGNHETFRIGIAEARDLARANGVRLIDIGCETTRAIDQASIGFGVMTKYNSVEAVQSISRALAEAKTVQEFLVSLSSDGLKVVVEPSFASKIPERQASIYSRISTKAKLLWTKVATVTFSGV